MKILFTNDAPLIKYGIAEGFRKKGCNIKIFPLWKIEKELQEQKFKEVLKNFKPDIIFTEGHSGLDQPSFFRCINEMNLNMFYWAIEDPVHIDWISMPYAKHSKAIFTTAEECIKRYEEEGLKAYLLPFACNPNFHYKTNPSQNYIYDIVFVGSNYDIRYDAARNIIMPFIERDYNIKVWGAWWQDQTRPITIPDKYYGDILPYEELPKLYSTAKIVLGLHCDDSSVTQTSMRTYEALGCGAFYLTQYTKAHEQLFNYKEHLVWSKSKQETIELANYYLNYEDERQKIAKQGQKNVYKHHTYEQRAEKVLKIAEEIIS